MDLLGPIETLIRLIHANWFPLLADVYQELCQRWRRRFHTAQYEVLAYEATLELLDPAGHTALFKKHLRFKFLQDHVVAFQDHVWGGGQILVDYGCAPGHGVDHYPEGDRWNVLISLRETKQRGEIEDFNIQRKIHHGFCKPEEWWQVEMQYQTRGLKLAIVFPPARPCTGATLSERTSQRTTTLGLEHFCRLPDGRQLLTWETKHPQRFETYTIQWRW